MTDQSEVRSLGKRRRTALRVFYGFVVAAIAAFTLGARASDSQGAMTAMGILLAGGTLGAFFASSEPQTHIRSSSTTKRRVLPLSPLCFSLWLSVFSSGSDYFPVSHSWFRH